MPLHQLIYCYKNLLFWFYFGLYSIFFFFKWKSNAPYSLISLPQIYTSFENFIIFIIILF